MGKRINSCAKGKRIEREACAFLTSLGFPAERGARNGVKSGADVLCPSLPNVRIEVKGDQSIDLGTKALDAACEQVIEDLPRLTMAWAVLWKPARRDWRLTYPDYQGSWPTVCKPQEMAHVLIGLDKRGAP